MAFLTAVRMLSTLHCQVEPGQPEPCQGPAHWCDQPHSLWPQPLITRCAASSTTAPQACMVPLDHDSPLPAAVSPANPNAAATSGAGAQAAAAQQQAKAA